MKQLQFTCQLMEWHHTKNTRILPWKGEKDAYRIWLSEIILQQTRAEQGWKYFEAFVEKYPAIELLAQAPDAEVFKLWEGLGYYARCNNMLATARLVVNEYGGKFPQQVADLQKLPGIGPYTAAAIASFAYNQPSAVLDGNVYRVLARCFGISTPIDSAAGKKEFTALAGQLIDPRQPALYNQAIMDFGATICKPASPLCTHCPLQKICTAYAAGLVNKLPVKEKAREKRVRWFTYFILTAGDKTLVQQRQAKDIWQHLYEFYLLETDRNPAWTKETAAQLLISQLGVHEADIRYISAGLSQQLTHQTVHAQFIKVMLPHIPAKLSHYPWYTQKQIKALAFPRLINVFLDSDGFPASLF